MAGLRKQYSRRFLRWARHFSRQVTGAAFSSRGLRQFFDYESQGIIPPDPDPYFHRLDAGRRMFNALQKQVRESYGTVEWEGWDADFHSMPGWLFAAFYSWRFAGT